MSTIPEIVVANNRGMQTIAVSIVTNVIATDGTNATCEAEVLDCLADATISKRLTDTFSMFFEVYHASRS